MVGSVAYCLQHRHEASPNVVVCLFNRCSSSRTSSSSLLHGLSIVLQPRHLTHQPHKLANSLVSLTQIHKQLRRQVISLILRPLSLHAISIPRSLTARNPSFIRIGLVVWILRCLIYALKLNFQAWMFGEERLEGWVLLQLQKRVRSWCGFALQLYGCIRLVVRDILGFDICILRCRCGGLMDRLVGFEALQRATIALSVMTSTHSWRK